MLFETLAGLEKFKRDTQETSLAVRRMIFFWRKRDIDLTTKITSY